MAYEIITPNMGLTVPSAGLTSGPQFALDINNSLTILDQHNHTPGSGVAITPLAIDINSDLTFAGNNATFLRTTRFSPQATSPAGVNDKGCLYVLGVDLYYNDESGNVIRLTQSGSIVGTSGSITGLTSPASASYSSVGSTFIWQSGTNIAANMDMGSITLRNLTAGSDGVTISPPSSLSTNYTLTLPVIPPAIDMMVMDTAGNMSNALVGPALSLSYTGTAGEPYTIDVKQLGITQEYIAPKPGAGLGSTAPVGGIASSSLLNGTQTGVGATLLGQAALTCSGIRPVNLQLIGNIFNTAGAYLQIQGIGGGGGTANAFIEFHRNGITITSYQFSSGVNSLAQFTNIPGLSFIDYGAPAGVNTYQINLVSVNGSLQVQCINMTLVAYEIN